MVKRDYPAGISQNSIDLCVQAIDAQGTAVNVYSTGDDSAQVDNVPAACMDLATVLTGEPAQAGGPVPTPLSSSSLSYTGLTDEDKTNLQNALSGSS
ncbi:hypothetical protein M8818_005372 [Zalaria obscura]|uniref:Uncharacterized protein n=1 Tax=Zalaria obscura TaxID=2024903 RepID=A0ACC3S946_9PEZI